MKILFLFFLFASSIYSVNLPFQVYQDYDIVTNIYIWRHGETDSNAFGILSGGGDTQAVLTYKGSQQTRELAEKIGRKELKLQAIYSSDLRRAMHTAETVLSIYNPEKIPSVISCPQLREVMHGKYERTSALDRKEKVCQLFKKEIYKIKSNHKSISEDIEKGLLDRFHFWKIHPINGGTVGDYAPIIIVKDYLNGNRETPETTFELYCRAHAEIVRIAQESRKGGIRDVGISTHGALLSTLINVSEFGNSNVFVPLSYQPGEIKLGNEVIMPMPIKVENCTLAHFRYWHLSQQLEFCGILD